ncbi:MAG: DNA-processing protein DprA [Sporolactobacillus sp.]
MHSYLERFVKLYYCHKIGRNQKQSLVRKDPQLDSLENARIGDLIHMLSLNENQARQLVDDYQSVNGSDCLHLCEREEIHILTVTDSRYPPLLQTIYDPPLLLFASGCIERLRTAKMLAVVGTRHPSREAEAVLQRLLQPIIEQGWTIVSGMAVGIDAMAHRIALLQRTIAVLGSGLNHPYPKQNLDLFAYMRRHQLVISEYPPETAPARWRFPERNRIISGLCRGTLVVEARARSGSLITADQALEQGREVFAVPGSLLNPNSVGTHGLIQQGAKLVMQSSDILEELSFLQEK